MFASFDEEGKECYEVVERGVDLDYWNIRQWRRLYFLLSERNKVRLTDLHIRPNYNDNYAFV